MMTENKIYLEAGSAEAAVEIAVANAGKFRYIAGGTDVLVNKFQGNETAQCLVDISGIGELKTIATRNSFLAIGALVQLEEVSKHELIRQQFPALAKAAASVASPILRKTATLGGNLLCENRCVFYNQGEWWRESVGYCLKCSGDICIATGGKKNCFSKFVSDTAPVLISLDARLEIISENGNSIIPLEDIYSGDGVNPRRLSEFSLVRSVLIPVDRNYSCVFKKLRPRESVDFTSLTTAVSVSGEKIKIVLGGVDPKPVIITGNKADAAKLLSLAVKKPRIVDNDYYPRVYRKEMIAVFIRQSFEELKIPC